MSSDKVDLLTSPSEYFFQLIVHELKNQSVYIDPHTTNYLVNLCVEFISTENLFTTDTNGNLIEEPLAIMLLKAAHLSQQQKTVLLKKLGDVALYISGFFSDSLNRKLVDIDYYISMGENAYKGLSTLAPKKETQALYSELSGNFSKFVDVFEQISNLSNIKNDQNIIRLYEKWLKTKSSHTEKLLNQLGIFPSKKIKDTVQ